MFFLRLLRNRWVRLGILAALPIVLFLVTASWLSWRPRTLRLNAWVMSVTFSPDGKLLASASGNATRLWDPKTKQLLRTITENGGNSVAFAPDGKTLATASSNQVQLWDVQTGKPFRTLTVPYNSSCVFSPDGKLLASWCRGRPLDEVRLWDAQTGVLKRLLPEVPQKGFSLSRGVQSIAFSPDSKILAGGGSYWTKQGAGEVRLWNVRTGKLWRTLKQQWGAASVAFAPDGLTLASADSETVRLWNVQSGRLQRTFKGHGDGVLSVTFSPDGKLLASASGTKGASKISLWDVQIGQVLRVLVGHRSVVKSLVFSPDGEILASGSWDKTVRLWRIR